MAKNQTVRLRLSASRHDRQAFDAIQGMPGYAPSNPAIAPASLVTARGIVDATRATETQTTAAWKAARDEGVATEWAFHNLILEAKYQVVAQYGADSDEVHAIGLKKKFRNVPATPTPPQPTTLTATGFGSSGANGALTVIGTFAGKPSYQAAGGWWYCWNPDGGMWICRDALPGTGDLSNNRYADAQYAADITAVVWGPGFNPGMMPYGTVS